MSRAATVTLDGRASFDPEGQPLEYAWRVLATPPGTNPQLADAHQDVASLTVDGLGDYVVALEVSDGNAWSPAAMVTITAVNQAPVAVVSPHVVEAHRGDTIRLDASGSSDPDGDPLTFAWTLSAPPGSTAAITSTSATASVTVDVDGEYLAAVQVSDGLDTASDRARVLADVFDLPGGIVDAAYSRALDRIVLVSDAPALDLVDGETGTSQTLALAGAPIAVSVAPTGDTAVVLRDGSIDVVDLATLSITATYPFTSPAPAMDVVDTGDWAYVFLESAYPVRCIDLRTGTEVLGTGPTFGDEVARFVPARGALYAATRDVSPDNLERDDVANGPSTVARDSPYWGDYAFCGDVWPSQDGSLLYTACGNVFRATDDPATDMRHVAVLSQSDPIRSVDTLADGTVAALSGQWSFPDDPDPRVDLYADDGATFLRSDPLPLLDDGSALQPSHGRFVFFRSNGSAYYAIVMVAARASIWRVAVATPPPAPGTANAGPDVALDLGQTATLDGSTSSGGDAVTYAWAITAAPASSTATLDAPSAAVTTFTPDRIGEYVVQLTVDDAGAITTDSARVLVERPVIDLAADVVDADYSRSLARVVALTTQSQLLSIDPATGTRSTIDLPEPGTSLSLSPDGNEAVVAHAQAISRVDLVQGAVTATYPVSAGGRVVDGGNGWAYVLPSIGQWVAVESIDLATGAEVDGVSVYENTVGRRHPTMSALYLADTELTPDNMERADLSNGAATYQYESPYWGDHPFCGNLWFTEDGGRMITRCGNLFLATADQATDITFAGTLAGAPLIRSAAHSLAAAEIAVLPDNTWNTTDADTVIDLYDDMSLGLSSQTTLPALLEDDLLVQGHGMFVFVDADGVSLDVIETVSGFHPRTVLWSTPL